MLEQKGWKQEKKSVIMFPVKFEFMILTKWPKLHEILVVMNAKVGADLWNER